MSKNGELKEAFKSTGLREVLDQLDVSYLDVSEDVENRVYVKHGEAQQDGLTKAEELLKEWNEDELQISELVWITSDRNFHQPVVDYYYCPEENWLVILSENEPFVECEQAPCEALLEQLSKHPARVIKALKKLAEQGQLIEVFDMKISPEHDYRVVYKDYPAENPEVKAIYREIKEISWEYGRDWNAKEIRCVNAFGKEVVVYVHISHWQGSVDYTATRKE